MRALKMRNTVVSHQKFTMTDWEDHGSWSSYNYRRSFQRTQHRPSYSFLAFETNWKAGASWADHKSKKNRHFEVWSYSMQQQQTISQSDCDAWQKVDFMWQRAMTSSVLGPRSSKALPKAGLAPKRGHGHCLVVCCLSDPLQLSESQRKHYIWEVCSAKRWDALKAATPAASVGQQKGPNSLPWQHPTTCRTTTALKVEWIGLQRLASSAIFT